MARAATCEYCLWWPDTPTWALPHAHSAPRTPAWHDAQSVGRGRSFCAVVTGPEEAAGQTVDVKGHAVSLKPGKCSPLMMGGKPFLEQKPKDMQTSSDSVVHWDGKVWSI